MKNIELKIHLNHFQDILAALLEAKAEHIGNLYQTDVYFGSKSGRLKLRNINNEKYELIFYRRPDEMEGKVSDYHIFPVTPEQIDAIISLLDQKFGKGVTVEKNRDLWIYNHTRVHLDSVVALGNFLELETVVKDINFEQAKAEYGEVIKLLSLSEYKKESGSYSDLLIKKAEASGSVFSEKSEQSADILSYLNGLLKSEYTV